MFKISQLHNSIANSKLFTTLVVDSKCSKFPNFLILTIFNIIHKLLNYPNFNNFYKIDPHLNFILMQLAFEM